LFLNSTRVLKSPRAILPAEAASFASGLTTAD
jgi:hypothetical protein